MPKRVRVFLLPLAVFADWAAAACNLFMPDLPSLAECVKLQEYKQANLSLEIEVLRKEIRNLRLVQGFHEDDIKKLKTEILDVQLQLHLLRPLKPKPAKPASPRQN